MNPSKSIAAFIIVIMLAVSVPTAITAASVEVTPSVKAAFDKTIAAADSEMKNKITKQFNDFHTLQGQDGNWDEKIKATHYKNEESRTVTGKQIYQIDSDKLSKLETQLKQTRERYQPLFDLYQSLNKQITVARSLGNKELSSLLRSKAEAMKVPVQLARQDIRTKENTLKTAKEERTKKINKIRGILADIDPINVQIRAGRSAAYIHKKHVTSEWKYFTEAVKKSDARRASDSLTTLVSFSRQIVEQKQKMYNLEIKISDILLKAKEQLSSTLNTK